MDRRGFIAGALATAALPWVGSRLLQAQTEDMLVYFGTYGPGIFRARFNPQTGTLTEPELAIEIPNPSWLTLSSDGFFLYSANEVYGRGTPLVSAFQVEAGALTAVNTKPAGGSGPCHLALAPDGRALLVANYGGGSITLFPIQADGSLDDSAQLVQHEGSSANPRRQEKPHAHGVMFLRGAEEKTFALCADLGLDQVLIYRLEREPMRLEKVGASVTAPGAGPRHLAYDPVEKNVFCINELNCTITVFRWDGTAATLKEFGTISLLPPGQARGEKDSAAEIELNPTLPVVYASVRGRNTIAAFAIETDGRLKWMQEVSSGGQTPRHFTCSPDGRWMLVSNQDSNNVVVLKINDDGTLSATDQNRTLTKPICAVFAR